MKQKIIAFILAITAAVSPCVMRAQVNVQKTSGTNAITGNLVIGDGKQLSATGTGAIISTSGTATSVAVGNVTGLGTGVATALAATPNATGGVVTFDGNIGVSTGTSLTLSDAIGTARDFLTYQTAFSDPSGNKSIVWKDATNPLGRVSVSYAASSGSTFRVGSLYRGGYQTDDLLTIASNGQATIYSPLATGVALLTLQSNGTSGATPSNSIEWNDSTNVFGRISLRYTAASSRGDFVFGSLYSSGYQSADLVTMTGTGNLLVGTSTDPAGAGNISAAGNLTVSGTGTSSFSGTTASTSTTTGTVTIAGGASAQGAIFGGTFGGGVQALSGAGAANVTTLTTALTSTGVADAITLANGLNGQIKIVIHDVDGGSSVLTPTTKTGFSTVTFTNAGDTVVMQYLTTRGWFVLSSYGAVVAP